MKKYNWLYLLSFSCVLIFFTACDKEEYFKSQSGTEKELKGNWNLIAIPKYNADGSLHLENWTFKDGTVSVERNGNTFAGTYSIKTSLTKVIIKVEGITADPIHFNGEWQVVKLNSKFLIIANDHDGSTGLTELEFQKGN